MKITTTIIITLVALFLSSCSQQQQQTSSTRVETVTYEGALAIYRHNALMNEKAEELQMIHPIALPINRSKNRDK